MTRGAWSVGGMRRSEWVRVGAGGCLLSLVAFGMGAAAGGHGRVVVPDATASVVSTRVDGECVTGLSALVDWGVRVVGVSQPLPRACAGFDRGAVLLEFQEVVVRGCGFAVRDGRYGHDGDDSCVGVSGEELSRLGVAVGRPFPVGAG